MVTAVVRSGENYERAFITRWIAEKQAELDGARQEQAWDASNQRAIRRLARGIPSPLTLEPLDHSGLVPNNRLRRDIRAWATSRGESVALPELESEFTR